MLKIKVSPKVAGERKRICEGCKFYKRETNSCGPIFTGRALTTSEEIEAGLLVHVKRKKYRLCGCKIDWKIWFHIAKCPIGKWEREAMTDREIESLKTLLGKVKAVNGASSSEIRELYKAKSQLLGINVDEKYCSSCVKTLVEELEHALKGV